MAVTRKKALSPNNLNITGAARGDTQFAMVADDIAFEDVLEPEYWVHVSRTLKLHQKVEIHHPKAEYYGEVYVRGFAGSKDTPMAIVAPIMYRDFLAPTSTEDAGEEGEPDADGYTVRWRGRGKWGIIFDGNVVKDGFIEKQGAVEWLTAHLTQTGRAA